MTAQFSIDGVTAEYADPGEMVAARSLVKAALAREMADGEVLICQHDGTRYSPKAAVNLALYSGARKFKVGVK